MEFRSTIETERLILREIKRTDAPFFYQLFNSEGWLTFIGDRNIKTIEDAENQIVNTYIPSYTNHGFGSYVVIEKTSNDPVGTCGLYKRSALDHPDVGFAFLSQHMGRGYGFEAASAILNDAFHRLHFNTVVAFTTPKNVASISLLQKLGMKPSGRYAHGDAQAEMLLFIKSMHKE
ncbi:MAG: GNAT family N-acetyltransferase [Marinirhabdus sp.]|nr:GNAT family N-acetyltransferase [Marinirhabdus sp.]